MISALFHATDPGLGTGIAVTIWEVLEIMQLCVDAFLMCLGVILQWLHGRHERARIARIFIMS